MFGFVRASATTGATLSVTKAFALGAMIAAVSLSSVHAAFFKLPFAIKAQVDRIRFETPSLSPLAHTRFCMHYPRECEVHHMAFRPRPMALTDERWAELVSVNRDVNRAIRPQRNENGLLAEEWMISPPAGECNSYAVTKRHELLARGWPSRALLLTEVVIPDGEHHLVLVVRTRQGDVVLDNLSANVRSVSQIRYQWVRAQSPANPMFWSTVSATAPVRVAMLRD